MSTNAVYSGNTVLKIEDAANPGTYNTVGEVKDISGALSWSRSAHDVTYMGASGAQYAPGRLSVGPVSFELNHVENGELLASIKNGDVRNFQLVLGDSAGTTYQFEAFVSKYEVSAPVDGVYTASVELTINGIPTVV